MDRIGDSVERELGRSGGGRAASSLGRLTAVWPEIVGESVSRNAWPLRIGRDGTLHVAASSATWAFELDRLAPEIAQRLAEKLGPEAPATLRFTVGPVPEPGASELSAETPADPEEIPPETLAEAAAAASAIEDPELRELALRAARASLSRPPSDRRF